MLLDDERFFAGTKKTFLEDFHEDLKEVLAFRTRKHGRGDEWDAVINSIQTTRPAAQFDTDTIVFGQPDENFEPALRQLLPWRKGPIQIGSTFIDTEWRSDWKWQRIAPHITPLAGRNVLDIGCGNGYHLFRMIGAGASLALGVDPTILFNYQFQAMQKLAPRNEAYLLPLRSEHLPTFNAFDTVFSLGVLYHRRSPVDHLTELMSFLRPGGELVLETLIIEGNAQTLLIPEDRYAMMANVWFIPSTGMLERMLQRAGLKNVRTVDVTKTTTEEQRATQWMEFQSLSDYLDPKDMTQTAEGYPAPVRATLVAEKP